jgi:ABC-type dipeptide/oligopeptide/nickel transport system permease component
VRGQYLAARLGSAVPTLLVISALVFALIRLAPGGPEQVFLGEQGSAE